MRRHRSIVRAFWLVCALLQLGLQGSAALADALEGAGAAREPAHLESHTATTCARLHPPDCALHRFLGTVALASRASTVVATDGQATAVIPAGATPVPARTIPPLPQPRAPPALS